MCGALMRVHTRCRRRSHVFMSMTGVSRARASLQPFSSGRVHLVAKTHPASSQASQPSMAAFTARVYAVAADGRESIHIDAGHGLQAEPQPDTDSGMWSDLQSR
jgi:hypothetical protein